MHRRLLLLLACALPLLSATRGGAQDVRGIVRDSASRAPIPGAVVEVLDVNGLTLRRTITNERGQYRAIVPPAARRLRVLRMGFRPQFIEVPSGERDVAMVAVPTLLQTVTTKDQPQCPSRSDRAQALALWEQARSALLATVVAREANPGFMRRLSYHRVVGERRPLVLSQVVKMDSALSDRPFVAPRSAEEFIRDGFLDEQADKRVFDAPDADVLLDDAFPLGYCFRLARPDKARPTHVGLAFEAVKKRSGRVDIDGTLWIDSVSRTLYDLTFRYQGLTDAEEELGSGGRLTFRIMPNGLPVIDTWSLQLASPRSSRDTAAVRHANPRSPRMTADDLELHDIGGTLASARWGDSTVWTAPLGRVRGRLLLQGVAIPHTELSLVGTSYRTRSDDEGRYEFTDLLPGRYVFALPDAALNAVGYELTHGQTFTVLGGSTTIADMDVPTDESLIGAKCNVGSSNGMLILAGRVLTSAGLPAQAASVEVFRMSSQGVAQRSGRASLGKGSTGTAGAFFSVFDGEGGASGKFWICGVEPSANYVVEAKRDGEVGLASVLTNVPGKKRRYTVTVTMDRPTKK